MAKVHDIGSRLYWQRLYWHSEDPPLIHRTTTQEIEPPYRNGRCLVLRVPFTKVAIVLGAWGSTMRESEALLSAVGGRVTKDNGIDIDDWDW
jgi:hypothetical protein